MDINLALTEIRKAIAEEKVKLDYTLKGAELLADLLQQAEKRNEARKTQDIERGEFGLETSPGTGSRNPI